MTDPVDLLIVGAGPTGIAIGAEARRAGVDALLVDRGGLCASIQQWPTDIEFFTTRDRLEIADIPFGTPDDKPTRRQALAYYAGVARRYALALAPYEEVLSVRRGDDGRFTIDSRSIESRTSDSPTVGRRTATLGRSVRRRARAVVLATGYFEQPRRLDVPGEELPWVRQRYREPWGHFGQHVVVVGGANSAVKTALDLWRHDVRVTLVHRGAALKPSVKYWLEPDIVNRIDEGSIDGRFETVVEAFHADHRVALRGPDGATTLEEVGAVYVQIGYEPDVELQRRCGVEVDADTLVPRFDPATCETNVPGLYVAGTLQAGRRTDQIFIENSRDHGERIVAHLCPILEADGVAGGRRTGTC
ncbi:MAG: YpdA family putative bacillithiol disulfide reductase [Acidobacteriota bacterium]